MAILRRRTSERPQPRHNARHRRRRRSARTWRVWAIVAIAAVLVIAGGFAVGIVIAPHHATRQNPSASTAAPMMSPPPAPSNAPTPSSASTPLQADFAQLKSTLHAQLGVVVSPVGTGQASQAPVTLGDWQTGPAWSTSKVPLVIAALREADPTQVTSAMKLAITESDNAAAESIWEGLGDPVTAAKKVEAVLRETGDPTTVESRKIRPEYTAFGQTIWSLDNQVRFTAAAYCDGRNKPIFDLMGQVEPGQSWGIGGIPGTQFKGGWGPSTSGMYLVRQIGVLTTPTGKLAVALAAVPESGSFTDGTADLTAVAKWLTDHIGELPAGQCVP